MTSQAYFLCVVLFFVTFKTTVSHSDDLHHQLYQSPVANDHQSKDTHAEQVRSQPVSSASCPQRCSCKKNVTHHIVSVDCSNKGLTIVPDLPETTVELSLRNNSISNITCKSFELLVNLLDLDLASNKIQRLPPCVFVSQSSSLINLKTSHNDIDVLDAALFKHFSHLETLDLSFNVITHLESRTFSDLVQLVTLNLSFNHISYIASDTFKGLHSLKTLSLLNNRLDDATSFHKDVFQDLGALETLDVKANLGSINQAVSALRNISHLYIEVNTKYEVLGAGFRQLTNLRVLNLNKLFFGIEGYKSMSSCDLSRAPSNFFGNIKTEKDFELYLAMCYLNLKGNDTFLFPSTLATLSLRGNVEIKFGKSSVKWMKSLINTNINYLDLSWTYPIMSHNYIEDWCFKYLAKINLKNLILKSCGIHDIRAPVQALTTLEKLDVSDNSFWLRDIYLWYVKTHRTDFKLKELYASNQKFSMWRTAKHISQKTSDANIVGDLNANDARFRDEGKRSSLSELTASVFMNDSQVLSKLKTMRQTINSRHASKADAQLPKIFNKVKLNCLQNFEEQDPDIQKICLPPELEVINANSAMHPMDIKYVPHIRIVNNAVLRHVELADNPLWILLGPVENVPSLQVLDLSRNKCMNLSVDFFKYMVSLQTLILKENVIGPSLGADINGHTFSTLRNLKVLDVSQNSIKDLSSSAFNHNRNLQILNLSSNQLTELQPTISTILNMSFLDLSGNLLPGLSEQTCEELKLLKFRNNNFLVSLLDNRLLFTCENLPFLHLVFTRTHKDIFYRTEQLQFKSTNGTQFSYTELAPYFPLLARECLVQRFFILILITFCVVVGTVGFCAVIYYKRWKLRYLYYIGRRRMHIGERVVDYTPDADVFITYDQDDLRWRRFMQQTFLPGLNQRNITYILGETDFPGGDLMAHVTGAVVGTRKTVVLLSGDIFDDHHREYEINLAIMREMDTRSLKIVPIFVEEVDLSLYPREIMIFLRNQWERCHSYSDSDDFWDGFVDAVREDD